MRFCCVTLLGLALSFNVSFADEKKVEDKKAEEKKADVGSDRADEFKMLKEDYSKKYAATLKAYQEAKTPEAKQEALKGLPNDIANRKVYLEKLTKLIQVDPKDDLSCEMLIYTIRQLGSSEPDTLDLLAKHHVKSDKITSLVQGYMSGASGPVTSLLRKISEEHPDKATKAFALMGLASGLKREGDAPGKEKELKQAKELFERIEKEFGDVEVRSVPLTTQVKGLLREIEKYSIGKSMADVEVKNLDDKSEKLSSYQGKVVVLDIWATWCPPCRAMIPHEREMVEKLKDKPFALISISADKEKETLVKFLDKEKMPWTHWWVGASSDVLKEWNVRFFPTMYVLDAKGTIRYKNIRGKALEEAVELLLTEAEKK